MIIQEKSIDSLSKDKQSYKQIIKVANEFRLRIKNGQQPSKPEWNQFLSDLEECKEYINEDFLSVFKNDLKQSFLDSAIPDFTNTRTCIEKNDLNKGFIGGLFNAPYNQELGFECMFYKNHTINPEIAKKYPNSLVLPISILDCTNGFKEKNSVALFPENFVSREHVQEDNKVFYFIDRFVKRTQTITIPSLNLITNNNAFQTLLQASEDEITEASITWVYLHEHFHRTGLFPIPQYLKLKSSKSAAALEEARTDILAIIACLELYKDGFEKGLLFAELILAERLFRYPLQNNPEANYDSRSSQVLYTLLNDLEASLFKGHYLDFDIMKLLPVFQKIVEYIRLFEFQIERLSFSDAKQHNQFLIKGLGGYSSDTETFVRLPFFNDLINKCRFAGIPVEMNYS